MTASLDGAAGADVVRTTGAPRARECARIAERALNGSTGLSLVTTQLVTNVAQLCKLMSV